MLITPGAAQVTPPSTPTTPSQGAQSARERAIARLTQPAPVPNPTQVSPEEMGAITSQVTGDKGQKLTTEATGEESTEVVESLEATEPAKAVEEPLSSQYAQLARKEKAIRAKAQEVRAREEALKAREEALTRPSPGQPPTPAFDESKYVSRDSLKANPMEALLSAGISYDDIAQMMLQPQPQMDPATKATIDELKAELKAIRGEQDSSKKNFQDQQQQAYKDAVNQIRIEAKSLVQNDPQFETIHETNSVGDVVELIERTFKEGLGNSYPKGTLLTVEQAATMVEEHLMEEAMKIARIKKIQERMKPQAPAPVATKQPINSQQVQQPQMKTLTNAVGSSRQLSARERAILAFKGERRE